MRKVIEKKTEICTALVSLIRDLEERRMRIAQIYARVLLYFQLKAAALDVTS